jgi:hypothetical protein
MAKKDWDVHDGIYLTSRDLRHSKHRNAKRRILARRARQRKEKWNCDKATRAV